MKKVWLQCLHFIDDFVEVIRHSVNALVLTEFSQMQGLVSHAAVYLQNWVSINHDDMSLEGTDTWLTLKDVCCV